MQQVIARQRSLVHFSIQDYSTNTSESKIPWLLKVYSWAMSSGTITNLKINITQENTLTTPPTLHG